MISAFRYGLLLLMAAIAGGCALNEPPPPIAGVGAGSVAVAKSGPGMASWETSVTAASIVPDVGTGAPGLRAARKVESMPRSLPKGGGYYKVGKRYQIAGVWYEPREDNDYEEVGVASWYGPGFHAKKTANGEIFDQNALTAAHRTLPMPSYVHVTNLANGKTILVRVNDRGPFKKGRILDVSSRVARELGFEQYGTTRVRVRYAGRAPLDGDDSREQAYLAGTTARVRSGLVAVDGL